MDNINVMMNKKLNRRQTERKEQSRQNQVIKKFEIIEHDEMDIVYYAWFLFEKIIELKDNMLSNINDRIGNEKFQRTLAFSNYKEK